MTSTTDFSDAASEQFLIDLGYERVGAGDHWSDDPGQEISRGYRDFLCCKSGWIAVYFRAADTGSSWESPAFPTAQAAYVFAELENWGRPHD